MAKLLADAPLAGERIMLSLMRIVVGLLYLQHGTSKLLGFPVSRGGMPEPWSPPWFAGCIELTGGILLVLGLLSRPAAFICAGQLAVIYWFWNFPRDAMPYVNGGSVVIAYCFVFLMVFFAGPGPISLDAMIVRKDRQAPQGAMAADTAD
ncbi:DoxX family protein [Falsiroseomonas sp. HW251]|uniref:DoxX family protein n=1 Tax=Falsiroseomonas sp. HW251 TaxID=3390998 RepID=UPI003D31A443